MGKRVAKPVTAAPTLRLGVYGGTFDPVHHGHLILARDALEQLGLGIVVLVPCARSPHKMGEQPQADARHRLAMLRAAVAGDTQMWVSACELERPAPSYSVDTARQIQEAFPKAELFWLVGDDQLPKLPTWERYAQMRRLVHFAAFARGSGRPPRLPAGVIRLPRRRRIDISATEIRERIQAGLPVDHLVPPAVAAYIKRHDLYSSPPA